MMTYLTPFERTGYDLFRSMRDWENEFFGEKSTAMSSCKTDIRDTGDSYVLEADMPGFQKEEIKLSLEGDVLTIAAEHTAEKQNEEAPEKDGESGETKTAEQPESKGTYLQRERSFCKYLQRLDISNVDVDHIDAAYENGVLTLTLPKKQPAKPEVKQIEIQ